MSKLNLPTMDRVLTPLALAAFLANAALWFMAAALHSGDAPVILHFRSGSGADLLGERTALRTIPAIGAAVALLNTALGMVLRRRDRTAATLFGVWAFLVQVFLALGLFALYLVNRNEGF